MYLPCADDMRLFSLWCLHEIAEIALTWTGRPPINYAWYWADHHDLAMIADGRR